MRAWHAPSGAKGRGFMLLDEKIGGTVHLALGAGTPEPGGRNENGIHRDFLCDMREGETTAVDGKRFYEAGRFEL